MLVSCRGAIHFGKAIFKKAEFFITEYLRFFIKQQRSAKKIFALIHYLSLKGICQRSKDLLYFKQFNLGAASPPRDLNPGNLRCQIDDKRDY